jgi:hypothetical protein
MLGPESLQVGANRGIARVPLQEPADPGARIREQRFMDELDGRRRALDVQNDGADRPQFDTARSGMYAGPMQSGWYPWSVPLWV